MSSVKISELSSVSEVLGTDESPVVQSSTTKKFSMTQLGSYILDGFSGLSLGGVTRTAKSAIDAIATALSTLSNFIGSTSMGTTATTVTGAIAEHEGDITSLKSNINDITYFSCTDAGSYYDITRQNCYAIGKRVFVSLELSVTTANPPTSADVAVIPSGYRPASNLNSKGFVTRENSGGVKNLRPALVSISTNGAIRQSLSSAFAASDVVVIWAEYMRA